MSTIKKIVALAVVAFATVATSVGQDTLKISTLVDLNGNLISSPLNLYPSMADVIYLDTRLYIGDGQELNIAPGTVIKASESSGLGASTVIITRGGKINAVGTADQPIILTAEDDQLDGTFPLTAAGQGHWGGVIILGRAYNNLVLGESLCVSVANGGGNGEGTIEGLDVPDERHHYGQDWVAGSLVTGFDDNDNSGVMRYVSIRHGGAVVGADNEINGLTLGSVGRGTVLENIEIVANQDDGIEFFGGTVDLKYANILFCNDDYIDWDQGYSGRIQFVQGVQLPASTTPAYAVQGDNGLEIDGDDSDSNPGTMSNPTVFNVTMIGNGRDEGIEAKEGTQGRIANSIIANFGNGIRIADENSRPGVDAVDYMIAGSLLFENNTFVGNTHAYRVYDADFNSGAGTYVATPAAIDAAFANNGNLIETNSIIDYTININAETNTVSGGYDAVPNAPAVASVQTNIDPTTVDAWFSPANYRGAFAPSAKPWTNNWTYNQVIELDNALVSCPTDANNDGTTNVSDFLLVLGQYNQDCGR